MGPAHGARRAAVVAVATVSLLAALLGPAVATAPGATAAAGPCTPVLGTTGIRGTVTEVGSGAPVSGAWVAVLRASDQNVVAGATTADDGTFAVGVAAGSYFLYLLDTVGGHAPGLFGAPTTVTVTSGAVTRADPTMAATRGSVAGTVTDHETSAAIPGAWVVALSGATAAPETATTADGSGHYTLSGLAAGPHLLAFLDPSGGHAPSFYPHAPDAGRASVVTVPAGGAAAASAALDAATGIAAGAPLSGTVREAGGDAGLPGVLVVVLRAADYRFARATVTDEAGRYEADLAPGDYRVGFVDTTGRRAMAWHDHRAYSALDASTPVTVPGVVDAALDPGTGSVAGTIVDDPSGAPLGCTWVVVIGADGNIAGGAVTGADGRYTVDGLRPGTYRAVMVDPTGGRVQEYWRDSASYAGATTFSVAPGAAAVVVDGDLVARAPFGAPTQWVARQFTELLGRPPTPEEWKVWTDYYGAQPACTAASLTVLPMYLTGLTTPTVPGLAPGPATEFTSLYPDTSQLDRALRVAAVVRAAYGHDPNDNDWTSRIRPYVSGTSTWSNTVTGLYAFIMAFAGPGTFCSLSSPAYTFGFSRALDLRANLTALTPGQPLTPSRSQAELEAALDAASRGATAGERTVTLRQGEVVRVGGTANANRPLVVPAGVTLTSEGTSAYAEPPDGSPRGLAYARMGRIVPATTAGTPAVSPADGLVCEGTRCNNLGLVSLAPGARLAGVWVDGMGLSDTNYKIALVRTAGSAADSPSTPYDDRTSVVANRLSEPSRNGAGLRLEGASTGTPCVGEQVLGNLVTGYSSRHQFDQRGQAQWVDGIVVSCEDATVAGNGIVDVTDLGIIVNGSLDRQNVMTTQRSQVRANTVVSAGLDAHVALGADAMGQCLPIPVTGTNPPQPPVPCLDLAQPRDFTGARIQDNRFFTGSRTSFDVGLMVGGGALWGDHRVTNLAPDDLHPDARGVAVTGNTTAGLTARVNIGIDVHDMNHATVTANPVSFRLVDGNPRITWGRCPQAPLLVGDADAGSLDTDAAFATDDRPRGCVIGEPPTAGLEGLRLSPDGSAFVGAVTGSTLRVWGGDLPVDPDLEAMVADLRDVRRMGINVIRLLLDTEDYLDPPACETCDPTVDTAAVDHLGDVAVAAEQMGLYLDITGLGIAYHHHNGSWFDDLDASPEAEVRRWEAQELFWRAVATELRPRTSVAWYDLINEPTLGVPATTWCFQASLPATTPCWNPNLVKSWTDPANPARQRTALDVGREWTRRMRDAIKVGAGDTVHPVSVGQLSFCAGALNTASRELADFDMVHMYPEDETLTTDINTVNNCKQTGRTLVVEETYYTASAENLERFFDSTQGRTGGYVGHIIGGTPVQLIEWLASHDPETTHGWWARVIWYAWDQFSLLQVALRNPTGPGIMPG